MWLVIMGFSPRRASHRRISTRKQCRKTQTHTNIPSGCTQDHWQAVIDWLCICLSLEKGHIVWMSVLMWISLTQHVGLVWRDLKMLVLWALCVCLCIHSLFLISPTSDSQTKPSDRPNAHRATNPDRTSLLQDQSEASIAHFYSTHHKYTTKVAHQHSMGLLPSIHTIRSLKCTL